MDHAKYAKQFWEQGYLYLPGFFTAEQMKRFNGMCLEHFGMNPAWEHSDEFIEQSNCEIVPWFPKQEGVADFDELEEDEGFVALTKAILGEGWNTLYCMSMFSKKGTKGQAWHQDCPPDNPEKFNLNRLVYTHAIGSETGGQVVCVPGSHKKGIITVGDPFENLTNQLVLEPKAGDVLLLHGHCWHRVLDVTGNYRLSTNFRAMPKDTPESITDIAVYRNIKYHFPTSSIIEDRLKENAS